MNTSIPKFSISIILDQEEVYDPTVQNVWSFKHVDDIVEGVKLDLCNMTSCYPFEVNGVRWRSSEDLYLAGEFSNDTHDHLAIQEELRAAKSPYAAKRFVKGTVSRSEKTLPSFALSGCCGLCGRSAKAISTSGANCSPSPTT